MNDPNYKYMESHPAKFVIDFAAKPERLKKDRLPGVSVIVKFDGKELHVYACEDTDQAKTLIDIAVKVGEPL